MIKKKRNSLIFIFILYLYFKIHISRDFLGFRLSFSLKKCILQRVVLSAKEF